MPVFPNTFADGYPAVIPLHARTRLTKPVPAYVGPGDVVSGAGFWAGLRAYSAATAGTKAVNLRRSGGSTPTQQDFNTLASGDLDVASISTFKSADGSTNLWVTALYDKSGNGLDVVQATQARQPAFVLSGLGSLPIMTFTPGSTNFLASAGSVGSFTVPNTWSAVYNNSTWAANAAVVGTGTGDFELYSDAANHIRAYDGGAFIATGNDNTWHAVQGIDFSSGANASTLYIDGSATAGTLSGTTASGVIYFGQDQFGQLFNGSAVEAGLWNLGFTSGQQSSMNSNQHTYWGF